MFYRNLFHGCKAIFRRCLYVVVIMATASSLVFAETSGALGYENLTRLQWQQDLNELDANIRQYHINPFWFKDEAGYKRLYQEAEDYIAKAKTVDTNIVNGYFEKLVAYISDGHSYVVNKTARFGALSYSLEWFGDDLCIISLEEGDRAVLGAKVLAFDGMKVTQANKRIAPFIPVVNASGFKFHSKDAYHFAGLMHVAGISKSMDSIELTLELTNGNRVKKRFWLHENNNKTLDFQAPESADTSLYRQQQDQYQWFTYLEKEQAIYLRYALVIEKTPGDINRLTAQLVQFLNSHNVQKLIIDERDNGGGDSFFNAPLINAIANNPSINQRGKLFVLTNHNTFSAAINFAGNMAVKTRALFVGEKVADRATFAGEVGPQARHSLPSSGIVVSLSFSEWNSTYDNDQRDAVGLDIPVTLTLKDFLSGRDPVLQACFRYSPRKVQATTLDNYASWVGRYDYSPDKALKIYEKDGELHMEVTEWIFSGLYPHSKNTLKTDLTGVELTRLPNGNIEFRQPNSKKRILHRLGDDQLKPLELLVSGQFDAAKTAYQKVHDENPKLLSIRGNSLGILASHMRARYSSTQYYDQLRAIAISLYGDPIASWDSDE